MKKRKKKEKKRKKQEKKRKTKETKGNKRKKKEKKKKGRKKKGLRKGAEPYAIHCVLAYLDTWGLREVLLKADNEPAIQALFESDGARGRRWKKSPKYSHQSHGAVENTVRRIESPTRTYVCVLQEKLGYEVDSKSIVLPWLVRHAAYVLSRFMKRDDGRSAWARLRGKECDSPLAQVGETVHFKVVRGGVAKLEPHWATGTFPGRTDESDEVIVGTAVGIKFARSFRRRTRDKQWQRDAFRTFIGVPWNPRGVAVEAPMASSRRKYITKSLVQQHGETTGCSVCLGISPQHTATCRERFERLTNPNATDVIPVMPSVVGDPSPTGDVASTGQRHATQPDALECQAVRMKRGAENSPMSSSAKRAHTLPSSVVPDPAAARC